MIPRRTNTQVRTDPLRSGRPERAGELVANAAGAAQQLVDQFAKEVQRVDEVIVGEQELEFTAELDRALYDQKDGALQVRGTRAIEAAEKLRERMPELLERSAAKLPHERQRQLLRQRAQGMQRQAMLQVESHAGAERRRVDEQSHTATLERSRIQVARLAALGNDAAVNETIADIDQRVALYGDRNGADGEAIALARAEAVSAARATQLQALVDRGDYEGAQRVYTAHGSQLLGKAAEDAAEWMQQGRVERDARAAVGRALARQGEGRLAVDEELGKVTDPATRALARKLVKDEYDRQDDLRKGDQEDAYLEASARMERAQEQYGVGVRFEDVVPVSLRNRMTPEQRRAIQTRADAPAENDAQKWIEFWNMDPADRAKLSTSEFATRYWQHFDESHRARAETMMKAGTGGEAGVGQLEDVRSFQQQVQSAATQAGIRRGADGTAAARAYEQFIDYVAREVDAAQRRGEPIAYNDRANIINRVLREWRFDVEGSRNAVGRWELTEDVRGQAQIPYNDLEEKDPAFLNLLRSEISRAQQRGSSVLLDRRTLSRLAAASYLSDTARYQAILYPSR